ncbi:hypothetical protein KEJ34_02585 [Candidatus Bathyarchaeota archaeon]|nr:hypothetical protein [Candidatus Bathyarchaeota archaeon]
MIKSMSKKISSVKKAREDLQRIIETCKSVEAKGLDPYLVDVEDLIRAIREYFPNWEKIEDLCLDTEALNHIASIVKMQGEWVKNRATALYRDPFLIEEKILGLPLEEIVEIFLESWRPIVEFEQLTINSFSEALRYWSELPPLSERWQRISFTKTDLQTVTHEDVVKEGFLSSESFFEDLESLWRELKEAASVKGRVEYWDFIGSDTYEETVKRAYLTSFLITYGYAILEIRHLEEETFILPNEKPSEKRGESISFPISINFEEWVKWREGRKA